MTSARREALAKPPVERWLAAHATTVALLFVLLGLLARLRAAHAPFQSPDEVLHLRIASSESLGATYRESLGNAHPPLFFFLLWGWRHLAHSDWALRILPVALGTAFLWSAWRWTRSVLGDACGLLTLGCLCFLPAIVLVTSELRAYALLLFLLASALWALESAFATGSAARIGLFTLLGGLALATHYSAFRVLTAASVYAAARILAVRRGRRFVAASPPRRFIAASPPRRFIVAWAAGQAALASLAAFFLWTHAARLRGSPLEREVRETWLRDCYWRAGESAAGFVARQTLALFQYLFSARAAGAAALLLFAGGVVWIATRRPALAALLAIPFVLASAGGLLAVYPYGGTRHSADLALFACSGTAAALTRATGERLWVAVAAAAALLAGGFLVSG